MKRATCLMMFAALLVLNTGVIHAADPNTNTLPVVERQVVKISAASGDGIRISIPRAALTIRNGVPGVFVVDNKEARFRMVRTGKTGTTKVDILSGLFGGETLVLGELESVHDGSPITVLTKTSTGKK